MVVQDEQQIARRQLVKEECGATPKQTTCQQLALSSEHGYPIIAGCGKISEPALQKLAVKEKSLAISYQDSDSIEFNSIQTVKA
jgi:hypothetical protein